MSDPNDFVIQSGWSEFVIFVVCKHCGGMSRELSLPISADWITYFIEGHDCGQG